MFGEKQNEHYERMLKIVRGHEEYLITHKMFVKVMHEKHNVCGLTDEELRRHRRSFWAIGLFAIMTSITKISCTLQRKYI